MLPRPTASFLKKQNNLSDAGSRRGYVPQSCQEAIDLLAQNHRVGLVMKRLQTSLLLRRKRCGGQQALIGRLSLIPMAHHVIGLRDLLLQMHHRLKEVVIEPHLVIEHIHRLELISSIEADRPEILANQACILLLHKAVIVLLIWTTAAECQASDRLPPEAHEMMIEKFGTVIRMQFLDGKWQPLQNAAKTIFHGLLPSSLHGHTFTPSSCHIDHLQAMNIYPI